MASGVRPWEMPLVAMSAWRRIVAYIEAEDAEARKAQRG